MENLELKAKLSAKMLQLESDIPYLKATGKGLKSGKILEMESIIHAIRPIMKAVGLKLSTEIVNVETRETLKDKGESTPPQLILVTNAELNFTWIDTETGYSETKCFHGAWCNYDNYGFALGSILTYFKRQYLFHELNIESDEVDAETYGNKHMSDSDKMEAFAQKMESEKKIALGGMHKATDSKELNFILNNLNDELKIDEDIKSSFAMNRDRIIIVAVLNCENMEQLMGIKKAVNNPTKEVLKSFLDKENKLKS